MDDITEGRKHLKQAICSQGGKILRKHIEEQMTDGWDKFIDLPTDKKTSKEAYSCSGKYKALKELLDWVDSEVREVE